MTLFRSLCCDDSFKKILDLASFFSKYYNPRHIISKDIFGAINEHNMQINLSVIKKEEHIFRLIFLGDDVKISRYPIFNSLVSTENLAVFVLEPT